MEEFEPADSGPSSEPTSAHPGSNDSLSIDEELLELVSWILGTEAKAQIYICLHLTPSCTSREISEESGLYPSTVREALATLHDQEFVTREKRTVDGAGNNPYEYNAIPSAELVKRKAAKIQRQLNGIWNLDAKLDGQEPAKTDEPVKVEVDTQR